MNFGDKIKQLRLEKNWTQEFVANKLNISMGALSRYETGMYEPKSLDLVKDFSNLFEVSTDYLLGNSDFKTKEDEFNYYKECSATNSILDIAEGLLNLGLDSTQILDIRDLLLDIDDEKSLKKLAEIRNNFSEEEKKKFDIAIKVFYENLEHDLEFYTLKQFKKEQSQYYMCPVYGQISAGQPNWAEECIEGRIPLDPDLMGIVNPEEHFFLRVNGESMNKIIRNGAFALIHKQDMVNDGEIAVVLVNGYDATLKKFTRQGDMIILEPQSTDTNIKTQVYDKTTPIKILGKYVGKREINK